jgi:phosphonate transport system substrate-binding protein
MKKLILLLAMAMVGASGALSAEVYKISIMPRFFNDKLTAMMTPLVEYLHKETGLEIELVLADDNKDYIKLLNRGDIAIGFENPIVYVDVHPQHEVIAAARELGEDRFRGIVVVRPDSPIKELKELRGKQVMITGKTSAGGYLSQKLSLMQIGMSMDDLKVDTAADNRQENVIIAVSIGDAEAGFVRESSLHVADKYIAPGSIKKAFDTEWVPAWAFSLDRNVPADVKAKIAAAILKLETGNPVLKALEIDGFVPGKDADYDPIRKALGNDR